MYNACIMVIIVIMMFHYWEFRVLIYCFIRKMLRALQATCLFSNFSFYFLFLSLSPFMV